MTYADIAEARDWAGFGDSADDAELAAILLAVDRTIDDYCGQRFTATSPVSARTFVADTSAGARTSSWNSITFMRSPPA